MTTLQYYVGGQAKLTGDFYNEAEALSDPSVVTVEVINGLGEKAMYASATREKTGVWYQVVSLTCAGVWKYRFAGTGALTAAAWKSLTVTEEPFGSTPNVY